MFTLLYVTHTQTKHIHFHFVLALFSRDLDNLFIDFKLQKKREIHVIVLCDLNFVSPRKFCQVQFMINILKKIQFQIRNILTIYARIMKFYFQIQGKIYICIDLTDLHGICSLLD